MKNIKIAGAQCDNVGEEQGFAPISIRYEVQRLSMPTGDCTVPAMVTHWQLTPEEIQALQNGAILCVELLGSMWPPSKLYIDMPGEVAGNG